MIKFEIVKKGDKIPYGLLLLADETTDAINKYIHQSEVYVAKMGTHDIGVFCLYEVDKKTIELKNIAVDEKYQSKGYGSIFIDFIKQVAQKKYENLLVGTPDIAERQIKFYEKNGFQKSGIRKNFFVDNYELPIFENGVQLKDMVLLKFKL